MKSLPKWWLSELGPPVLTPIISFQVYSHHNRGLKQNGSHVPGSVTLAFDSYDCWVWGLVGFLPPFHKGSRLFLLNHKQCEFYKVSPAADWDRISALAAVMDHVWTQTADGLMFCFTCDKLFFSSLLFLSYLQVYTVECHHWKADCALYQESPLILSSGVWQIYSYSL